MSTTTRTARYVAAAAFVMVATVLGCGKAEPSEAAVPSAGTPAPVSAAPAAAPSAGDTPHAEPGHGHAAEPGEHNDEHHDEDHEHGSPLAVAPSQVLADGARIFGQPLDAARAVTPLRDIMTTPARFADQVVKTEGEIARVCQSMGCWMELRADAQSEVIRVPMAGHAFVLPRDVGGKHAVVQGRVSTRPMDDGMRRHLEAEGATTTATPLAIEATGVAIR